jgi:hypothetical protein
VSPKKTRVGNARSAYGEYGRFAGNDFSKDSVVAEAVSCARILGALAATSTVMNVTMDKNRVQLRLVGAPSLLKVVLPRKNALQVLIQGKELAPVTSVSSQLRSEGATEILLISLSQPGSKSLDG